MISCCAMTQSASLQGPSNPKVSQAQEAEILEKAAAQLQRLAPFKRSTDPEVDHQAYFPFSPEELQTEFERTKRSHESQTSLDPLNDAELELLDQERIKRSGGFLSGIANTILSKLASASAGASSGVAGASSASSGKSHPVEIVEYGPPVQSYDDKSFDVWAFKKAILNTLFQALKAISGGAIALKGQLIKGGGHLISAKGRIISAKGEAISSLGRHIASSALLTPPKSSHSHPDYTYGSPAVISGHDVSYDGPPPSAHGYSSSGPSASAYASPSDDDAHAGLLILKPIKPEHNHDEDHSHQDHHQLDLDPRHPSLAALEESFGGSPKGSNSATSSSSQGHSYHLDDGYYKEHKDEHQYEPATSYGLPDHSTLNKYEGEKLQDANHEHSNIQDHQVDQVEPQKIQSLASPFGSPSHEYQRPNSQPSLSSHSNSIQQIQSLLETPNSHLNPYELPKIQSFNNFNALPFSAIQLDEPLKIPIIPAANSWYGENVPNNFPSNFGQPSKIPLVSQQSFVNGYGAFRRQSAVEIQPSIGFAFKDTKIHRI
ncbi:uncharacterized protein LOC107264546 isoform X2 [Cephus cinctus]|nr:uncharacterized protein LOC107264546 isoform X2 [Cephus cinctus]